MENGLETLLQVDITQYVFSLYFAPLYLYPNLTKGIDDHNTFDAKN